MKEDQEIKCGYLCESDEGDYCDYTNEACRFKYCTRCKNYITEEERWKEYNDGRRKEITHIIEHINDINNLIFMTNNYILKYPEDGSLKFNLKQLKKEKEHYENILKKSS